MSREDTAWSRDLSSIPGGFSQRRLDAYFDSRGVAGLTGRAAERSYKLLCESYGDPSSIRVASCLFRPGNVRVKCLCYRSQKKSSRPYEVELTLEACGSITSSKCQCAAGISGVCSHSMAALKLLVLLKSNGYQEPPPELSCTELPQQWRRPRSTPLAPLPLEFIDWRRVREGGLCEPLRTRFYDAAREDSSFTDVASRMRILGAQLSAIAPSTLSRHLQNGEIIAENSMLGPTPLGSPLHYLKPLVPHGFQVVLSPDIPCGHGRSEEPTRPDLFKDPIAWVHSSVNCPPEQLSILKALEISYEGALALEQNTRQQAGSNVWKAARRHRVTASSFGVVVQRTNWTEKGLHNFTSQKDLSRVRAVQYGIANEQPEVHRYTCTMRTRSRDVEAFRCGLLVDPSCPWLGASPDRVIFDPCEEPKHGLLEVKCPYSLKGKALEEIGDSHYMKQDEEGIFRLDRSHQYYYQVLGQMAVSGLRWTDFVVFSEKFMIVERIRFSEEDWADAMPKLNTFFFSVLLPYLASKQPAF